jgi:hypothetical protein
VADELAGQRECAAGGAVWAEVGGVEVSAVDEGGELVSELVSALWFAGEALGEQS